MKSIKNRKARHEYFIVGEIEAGIVLKGTEIKSIRQGKVSFKDSYATIRDGEAWLISLHISHFEKGNIYNHEPERKRKLLLHKSEIKKLKQKIDEKGMTLVPIEILINESGYAKVIIALASGKKLHDKRDTLQQKQQKRDMDRRLKQEKY